MSKYYVLEIQTPNCYPMICQEDCDFNFEILVEESGLGKIIPLLRSMSFDDHDEIEDNFKEIWNNSVNNFETDFLSNKNNIVGTLGSFYIEITPLEHRDNFNFTLS